MKPVRKKRPSKGAVLRLRVKRSSKRDDVRQLLRKLQALAVETRQESGPLVEQLRQCPETFVAGELLEKVFDALKHGGEGDPHQERLLPTAGVVVPLV